MIRVFVAGLTLSIVEAGSYPHKHFILVRVSYEPLNQ
jgi:hypothetical protein